MAKKTEQSSGRQWREPAKVRTHPADRLPLGVHAKGGGKFEVGVTNLWGQFRLEDMFEPIGEHATQAVCEAWIAHMQKAHEDFCATLVMARQ